MLKVTHPDYQLSHVLAVQLFEQASVESGASQPIYIEGCNELGEIGEYYVKLKGHPALSYPKAALRELISLWIAHELELPAVEPACALLTQEFVDTQQNQPWHNLLSASLGLNFASRNAGPGVQILTRNNTLDEQLALRIFIFDLFIDNPDRGFRAPNKPNILIKGEQLFLIDHEKAFSFLDLLFLARDPWELTPDDLSAWVSKHLCRETLRNRYNELEGDAQVETLSRLDAHFWECVQQHLPREWSGDPSIRRIEATLSSIVGRLDTFKQAIQRMLT